MSRSWMRLILLIPLGISVVHSNRAPQVMHMNGCAVARCPGSPCNSGSQPLRHLNYNPIVWVPTDQPGAVKRQVLPEIQYALKRNASLQHSMSNRETQNSERQMASQSILSPSPDNKLLWMKEDLHLLNNSWSCVPAHLLRVQGARE